MTHSPPIALEPAHSAPAAAELRRLAALPRYQRTVTSIVQGIQLEVVDGRSFVAMYEDIFRRRIYRFKSASARPVIIDAGANIGLSVIYFARMYPSSRIVALEPDPVLFPVLKRNLKAAGLKSVELLKAAAWTCSGRVPFLPEGSDSGRLVRRGDSARSLKVRSIRLRDLLSEPIDLLKLDIEGSETAVVRDCVDRLDLVSRLFVEHHSFVGEPQDLDELLTLLRNASFRVYLDAPTTVSQPFLHQHEYMGMDQQTNIFAIRRAEHGS